MSDPTIRPQALTSFANCGVSFLTANIRLFSDMIRSVYLSLLLISTKVELHCSHTRKLRSCAAQLSRNIDVFPRLLLSNLRGGLHANFGFIGHAEVRGRVLRGAPSVVHGTPPVMHGTVQYRHGRYVMKQYRRTASDMCRRAKMS